MNSVSKIIKVRKPNKSVVSSRKLTQQKEREKVRKLRTKVRLQNSAALDPIIRRDEPFNVRTGAAGDKTVLIFLQTAAHTTKLPAKQLHEKKLLKFFIREVLRLASGNRGGGGRKKNKKKSRHGIIAELRHI